MSAGIPARFVWALEHLPLSGTERVLEIGCGHGVLAGLVCQRLTNGALTAIDRSAKMVAAATERNAMHVASGKARFVTAALADAGFGNERFDLIIAVNVNLFWIDPRRELLVVRRLLAPLGTLQLFYEPPGAAQADKIAALLPEKLGAGGFAIPESAVEKVGSSHGVRLRAHPPAD